MCAQNGYERGPAFLWNFLDGVGSVPVPLIGGLGPKLPPNATPDVLDQIAEQIRAGDHKNAGQFRAMAEKDAQHIERRIAAAVRIRNERLAPLQTRKQGQPFDTTTTHDRTRSARPAHHAVKGSNIETVNPDPRFRSPPAASTFKGAEPRKRVNTRSLLLLAGSILVGLGALVGGIFIFTMFWTGTALIASAIRWISVNSLEYMFAAVQIALAVCILILLPLALPRKPALPRV
jgi:hypothetical protein